MARPKRSLARKHQNPVAVTLLENPVRAVKRLIELNAARIDHDCLILEYDLPSTNRHLVKLRRLHGVLLEDLADTPFESIMDTFSSLVSQSDARKIKPYADLFESSLRECIHVFDENLKEFMDNCGRTLFEDMSAYMDSVPFQDFGTAVETHCLKAVDYVVGLTDRPKEFPDFWEHLLTTHHKLKELTLHSTPTRLETFLEHVLEPNPVADMDDGDITPVGHASQDSLYDSFVFMTPRGSPPSTSDSEEYFSAQEPTPTRLTATRLPGLRENIIHSLMPENLDDSLLVPHKPTLPRLNPNRLVGIRGNIIHSPIPENLNNLFLVPHPPKILAGLFKSHKGVKKSLRKYGIQASLERLHEQVKARPPIGRHKENQSFSIGRSPPRNDGNLVVASATSSGTSLPGQLKTGLAAPGHRVQANRTISPKKKTGPRGGRGQWNDVFVMDRGNDFNPQASSSFH